MTNGLKVYYAPMKVAFQGCTLPAFFPLLPLLREIVIREGIQIIHGHQDSSAMVHEALFHAKTLVRQLTSSVLLPARSGYNMLPLLASSSSSLCVSLISFCFCLSLSLLSHYVVSPLELLPILTVPSLLRMRFPFARACAPASPRIHCSTYTTQRAST